MLILVQKNAPPPLIVFVVFVGVFSGILLRCHRVLAVISVSEKAWRNITNQRADVQANNNNVYGDGNGNGNGNNDKASLPTAASNSFFILTTAALMTTKLAIATTAVAGVAPAPPPPPQKAPSRTSNYRARMTDEQRLMNKLFRSYDRHSRPVFNNNDPVVISMSLTIRQIFELDEKNQVLIIDAWVNFEWVDEYLTWDPRNYSDLEVVRIVSWKMWLPDIVLYNNAADFSPNEGFNSRAMVASNGLVFWSVPSKLSSSCKIDVTYFPFDEQVCRMKFGSWTHDGFKIDLINSSMTADLAFYVPNGEWDLISAEQRRNVVVYTCCVEPYPDVTFIIHIRRKGLYYVLNVFLPCFLMSGLTILVFLLPAESGEKCGLGITIMLSFAVFMLSVIEKLPDTSESFPLISIYLTAVMSTIAITVCISVFVLSLNYRTGRGGDLPDWLRRCLDALSPLCCIHDEPPIPGKETLSLRVSEFLHRFGNEFLDNVDAFAKSSPVLHRVANTNQVATEKAYRQIAQGLNRMLDRQKENEKETKGNADWRRLAQLADRCLYWILLGIFLFYTFFLLVFVPNERIL